MTYAMWKSKRYTIETRDDGPYGFCIMILETNPETGQNRSFAFHHDDLNILISAVFSLRFLGHALGNWEKS